MIQSIRRNLLGIWTSFFLAAASGACYAVGTFVPASTTTTVTDTVLTLSERTPTGFSLQTLVAIISAVAFATWIVATMVQKILDSIREMKESLGRGHEERRDVIRRLAAIEMHINTCPVSREDIR